MKTSLRKLVATVSGLAIAAVLPMTALMASAEGTGISFTADKTNVQADDTVKVSINVSGIDETNYWNVLDYAIGYDAAKVQPVKQKGVEWAAGEAISLMTQKTSVNLDVNPILGAVIDDTEAECTSGEVMNIAFKVKEGVKDGEKITFDIQLKQFAQAVIVDGKAENPKALATPGNFTVEVTVGEDTPVPPVVDRKALDKAITDAEAVLKDGKVYTAETLKAVEDALTAAKAVPADADQATVDAAAKALNDAVAALEEIVIPPDLDTEAFEEALAKAVAAALLEDDYTAESFAAFDAAMEAALAIMEKEDLTQADVDAATKAINDALALLVEKNTTPSTDPSTNPSTNPTDPTDPTVPSDVTDPIVVPGDDTTTPGAGAQTGESTTLFVLALVLMAGSAVALVGMKKKVFSK